MPPDLAPIPYAAPDVAPAPPAVPSEGEPAPDVSAAEIWAGRFTQLAHRLACVAWILGGTAVGVALTTPAGSREPVIGPYPLSLFTALAIFLGGLGVLAGVLGALLAAWEAADGREAVGAAIFAAVPLLAAIVLAVFAKYPILNRPPQRMEIWEGRLQAWLVLDFGLDVAWTWATRAAAALLALWIAITTALTRRGGE